VIPDAADMDLSQQVLVGSLVMATRLFGGWRVIAPPTTDDARSFVVVNRLGARLRVTVLPDAP
jgi:hypothetical protein